MGYDFEKIISQFEVNGKLVSMQPFGEGHINETFVAVLDDGVKVAYVLQKINHKVFPPVKEMMQNIMLVTDFCAKSIKERGGDAERECMHLIKAKDGKAYYYSKEYDAYFRMHKLIDDVNVYQTVDKPEQFCSSAEAFGKFVSLLSDFDASLLYEVIPGFHDTVKRFNDFKKAVEQNVSGKAESVKEEIAFVLERKEYCNKIVDLLNSGKMPVRVTHNDTKLNNVLFDKKTGKALCVIDLDTVMPGSICYDFGDAVRFGCNPVAEDEKDLSKVNFDINLFEQYVKGTFLSLREVLTDTEIDNLAFGSILMTYECGMRFLGDHINGDVYFRAKRENHNLDRARTQFKLVSDMEKQYDKMCEIVNKYR